MILRSVTKSMWSCIQHGLLSSARKSPQLPSLSRTRLLHLWSIGQGNFSRRIWPWWRWNRSRAWIPVWALGVLTLCFMLSVEELRFRLLFWVSDVIPMIGELARDPRYEKRRMVKGLARDLYEWVWMNVDEQACKNPFKPLMTNVTRSFSRGTSAYSWAKVKMTGGEVCGALQKAHIVCFIVLQRVRLFKILSRSPVSNIMRVQWNALLWPAFVDSFVPRSRGPLTCSTCWTK